MTTMTQTAMMKRCTVTSGTAMDPVNILQRTVFINSETGVTVHHHQHHYHYFVIYYLFCRDDTYTTH